MDYLEADYPCVGVCMNDADGYCLGCGRPPWPVPDSVPDSVPNSVSDRTPTTSGGTPSRPGETAPTDDDPPANGNADDNTAGVPS